MAQATGGPQAQQEDGDDGKDLPKQRTTRTNAATAGHPTPQASVKPAGIVSSTRRKVVDRTDSMGVGASGTMDTTRGLSGSDRMLRSASKGAQAGSSFAAPAGYRVNKRDDQPGGSGAQQWY
jgi:casein kinase I family protein HRR25